MIFQLQGTLNFLLDDSIVINANGVGYQVFIPETIRHQLPEVGVFFQLFIFHHIREDQQHLYGFTSIQDRKLFIILTSVSGVGPKVGIKILSYLNSSQLINAILQNDIKILMQVSGVGKKMAERLCVELKDKLENLDSSLFELEKSSKRSTPSNINQDYILTLKALGYTNDEIKQALAKTSIPDNTPIEKGIKILLKHL